jgi:cadmium resistance protein CadD (predicted permease)
MAILGAVVLLRGDPRVWQEYSGWIVSFILILLGVYLIVRRGRVKNPD